MSAIAQSLESIIGANSVVPWEELDSSLRGQILAALRPTMAPACVVYPNTWDELAEVVTCANRERWGILPCGSGSKLMWGGLADNIQIILSTARLNRLVDHAVGDMTVTVDAGLRFADLQTALANVGQFLAIAPTYAAAATLGGIVATGDTGWLRHRYGGVRDLLIGISMVRADGQIAKAGGRVVKNVAGYDLMKLFTGSWGTLGIISQLTFRVYPLPPASQTVVLQGVPEAIAQASQTLLTSALTPTAMELVSPHTLAALELGGDGMGLVVRFQGIAVGVEKQAEHLLEVGQTLGLKSLLLANGEQDHLWHRLQHSFESEEEVITCKIGVLPAKAVITLDKLNALLPTSKSLIHAGSGLGKVQVNSATIQLQDLLTLRQLCEHHGGFLTLLQAPSPFKEKMEVWGYTGNALALMQGIKAQFDPTNLLSPHRFVGGI
jgi:glycolate oxidase FAD binding subunit